MNPITLNDFKANYGAETHDGNLMIGANNRLVRVNRGKNFLTQLLRYEQKAYTSDMDLQIRTHLLNACVAEYRLKDVADYAYALLFGDGVARDGAGRPKLLECRDIKAIIAGVEQRAAMSAARLVDLFAKIGQRPADDDAIVADPIYGLMRILAPRFAWSERFVGQALEPYSRGPLFDRIKEHLRRAYDENGCQAVLSNPTASPEEKRNLVERVLAQVHDTIQGMITRMEGYQKRYEKELGDCVAKWSQNKPEAFAKVLNEFVKTRPRIWEEPEFIDLQLDGSAEEEYSLDDNCISVETIILSKCAEFEKFREAVDGDGVCDAFLEMKDDGVRQWYDGLAGRMFDQLRHKASKGRASIFDDLNRKLGLADDSLRNLFVKIMGAGFRQHLSALESGGPSADKISLVMDYLKSGAERFEEMLTNLGSLVKPLSLADIKSSRACCNSLDMSQVEKAWKFVLEQIRQKTKDLLAGANLGLDAYESLNKVIEDGTKDFDKLITACDGMLNETRVKDTVQKIRKEIENATKGVAEEIRNGNKKLDFSDRVKSDQEKLLKDVEVDVKRMLKKVVDTYLANPSGPDLESILDKTVEEHLNKKIADYREKAVPVFRQEVEHADFIETCDKKLDELVNLDMSGKALKLLDEANKSKKYALFGLFADKLHGSILHGRCSLSQLGPVLYDAIEAERTYLKGVVDKAKSAKDPKLLDDSEFKERLQRFMSGAFVQAKVDVLLEDWSKSKKVYESVLPKVEKMLQDCLANATKEVMLAYHVNVSEEELKENYEFSFEKFFEDNLCSYDDKSGVYRLQSDDLFGEKKVFQIIFSALRLVQNMSFGIGMKTSDEETILAKLKKQIAEGVRAANQGNLDVDPELNKMRLSIAARAVLNAVKKRVKVLSEESKTLDNAKIGNWMADVGTKMNSLFGTKAMDELLIERFQNDFEKIAEDDAVYHPASEVTRVSEKIGKLVSGIFAFFYGTGKNDPSLQVKIHDYLISRAAPEKLGLEREKVETQWFYTHMMPDGKTVEAHIGDFMEDALKRFILDSNFDEKKFYEEEMTGLVDNLIQEAQSDAKAKQTLREAIEGSTARMVETTVAALGVLRLGDATSLFGKSLRPTSFTLMDVLGQEALVTMARKEIEALAEQKLKGVRNDGSEYEGRLAMTTFEKFDEKRFVGTVLAALKKSPAVQTLEKRAQEFHADMERFCKEHKCAELLKRFADEIRTGLVEELKSQSPVGQSVGVLERIARRTGASPEFKKAVEEASRSQVTAYVKAVYAPETVKKIEEGVNEILDDFFAELGSSDVNLQKSEAVRETIVTLWQDELDARADSYAQGGETSVLSDVTKIRGFVRNNVRNARDAAKRVLEHVYATVDGYELNDSGIVKSEVRRYVERHTFTEFLKDEVAMLKYMEEKNYAINYHKEIDVQVVAKIVKDYQDL